MQDVRNFPYRKNFTIFKYVSLSWNTPKIMKQCILWRMVIQSGKYSKMTKVRTIRHTKDLLNKDRGVISEIPSVDGQYHIINVCRHNKWGLQPDNDRYAACHTSPRYFQLFWVLVCSVAQAGSFQSAATVRRTLETLLVCYGLIRHRLWSKDDQIQLFCNICLYRTIVILDALKILPL